MYSYTLPPSPTASLVGYNMINIIFFHLYYNKSHSISSLCVYIQVCRKCWKWRKWRQADGDKNRCEAFVELFTSEQKLECSHYVNVNISPVRELDGAFMQDCSSTCVTLTAETVIVAEKMWSKRVYRCSLTHNIHAVYVDFVKMWSHLFMGEHRKY